MDYIFESEQFALSDHSLHLLRSRFNYKTYPNNEIREISIKRGRLIDRWIVILVFGLGLVGFSIYYSVTLYLSISNGLVNNVYIEQIVIPVIPLFLGIYCLYFSLRTGIVAKVVFEDNKRKSFPLDTIKDKGEIDILINYLQKSDDLKRKSTIQI